LNSCGGAHRRHADAVAGGQPRVGGCPAAVHPHLAAANDAVDVGFGNALEALDEEIVQPLAGIFFVGHHLLHAHLSGGLRGWRLALQPGGRSRAGACFRAYNLRSQWCAVSA
jgi:hypothetical protein